MVPSSSGTCNGTSASVSCALTKTTQDSVTVVADSDSCNSATTNVALTNATSVAVTCTPATPKAGQAFTCAAKCNNVDAEVTWASTHCSNQTGSTMSCTVNTAGTESITATPIGTTSGCTSKTTNLIIEDANSLTVSCTNVTEGGTTTCTSDVAVAWDFQESQLASCDSSAALNSVNCNIPYDYTGLGIVNVLASEPSGLMRTKTVQLVISERSLSDLTITCDSDILARQDFSCSAKCASSNASVTWNNSECTT